jgi:transcriptional regulator with XRE-family HTH domain
MLQEYCPTLEKSSPNLENTAIFAENPGDLATKFLQPEEMRFSEKIKIYETTYNLSHQSLADRLGGLVSGSTVRRWVEEEGDPRLSELEALAEHTGLPIAYWADRSLDQAPTPTATADQRLILDMVKKLRLSTPDAILRLTGVQSPDSEGADEGDHGPGTPAASYDELAPSTEKRTQEIEARKAAEASRKANEKRGERKSGESGTRKPR